MADASFDRCRYDPRPGIITLIELEQFGKILT